MNYDRVVAATMESLSVTAADNPIIELQIPANAFAEIIRVEIGAAEGQDPVAEVQELGLYKGPNVGTGGTALTEVLLRGEGTIVGAALRNLTGLGASPKEFYFTAYNCQVGWLYLPVPEERPLIKAGDDDVFGINFPTAPDAAITFSATIIWGEVG